MDVVKCEVKGIEELTDALKQLPKELSTKVMRGGLRKAGTQIRRDIVAESPKDSGLLADHFKIGTRINAKETAGIVLVYPDDKTFYVRGGKWAGRFTPAFIALLYEFGHAAGRRMGRGKNTIHSGSQPGRQAPNPFITRAWERGKSKYLETLKQSIRDALKL